MKAQIDIGIFAYNEGENIKDVLNDMMGQLFLGSDDFDARFFVLANGCSDNTVSCAEETINNMSPAIAQQFSVLDLPFKGKSKTWNHFVHTVARKGSGYFCFVDADIRITNKNQISSMIDALSADEGRYVVNSRPVKHISAAQDNMSLVEKLILSAGNASGDYYKSSICGQLYMVKARAVTDVFLPQGLPVEDGFLKAMLVTDLLMSTEDLSKIYGDESISHVYESITTVRELISHQTRIIIGSSINAAIFRYMRQHNEHYEAARQMLSTSAEDSGWLRRVIKETLPRFPYGFVPFHFLVKRLQLMHGSGKVLSIKKLAVAILGFGFDFIIYCIATVKMAMGKGVGYW